MQDKQYKALWERLVQREELVFGNTAGPEVDQEDVWPTSVFFHDKSSMVFVHS